MHFPFERSITHFKNLELGLTVKSSITQGEGDAAVSFVRYSDGSTWYFDAAIAERIGKLFGYRGESHEAWFLTRDRALDFDAASAHRSGEPEQISADRVELSDIKL